MPDFINSNLAENAKTFTNDEVFDFVNENPEAIRFLKATKDEYEKTGEIDDWECDLASILFK